MLFNSLLMFDIVFIFFLFLVGVTCLLYYLPPKIRKSSGVRTRNSSISSCDMMITSDMGNCSSKQNNITSTTTTTSNSNDNKNNTKNQLENYETYYFQHKRRRNTYTNELAEYCDDVFYNNDSNSSSNSRPIITRKSTNSSDTVVRINENYINCTCNNPSCNGGSVLTIIPNEPQFIEVEIERSNSLSCYVKAKDFDIKPCNGPVFDV